MSKTAPNGDVEPRFRATQPSMPSPAKTTPSRIIDSRARSTGRKWIMAMTTKSRMSRAIVIRLAIVGVATPRGSGSRSRRLLPRGDTNATDYPRGRASAQPDGGGQALVREETIGYQLPVLPDSRLTTRLTLSLPHAELVLLGGPRRCAGAF